MSAAAAGRIAGWCFGALLLAIGLLNLLLVHPVPALAYGLLSLPYLPPVGAAFARRSWVRIHPALKIVAGIAALAFTLGVSDLGEMID
jgi:hypothetical protein